jgi:uncharacterized SAM-binding protein YcdF (DUF218 family)
MMPWLSPLALALLGVLILLPALAWRRRLLAGLGMLLGLVALALMTPIGANALVGAVEDRARPGDGECEAVDAIVLLAGGLRRPARHREDFDALTERSLARTFGLVERRRDPRLPLLVAGGGRFEISEAELIGALLQRLRHGHDALLLETASRTTWENAAGARRLLPERVRRIALATSALHLPRARRVFAEAGFEVCRWPLDFRYIDASGPGAWWPQSSALLKSEAALHELAGIAYYRFRERWPGRFTPEFPDPAEVAGSAPIRTSAPAVETAPATE